MQKDEFEILSFPSLENFTSGEAGGSLNVLIATEEIIGPVRNGGIASTYYHLARGLAAEGHKVTVLYLKGRTVENETPEHWIDHYAGFGIDLVYLPELEEPLSCASGTWQWRWLSFYRWLKANDRFDMVHTSEWRGGAFYCLQAKRLGLAFQDTLFVMKTSSPYIWNRHYQMRPIDKPELIVAAFAEQKCVEWSDIVVGGSAHLLSFMDHIGYALPEGRTYVQPNIVDFAEVAVTDERPGRDFGDNVRTKELVFFGRLEPRKGLELFVFAIDALVARGVEIGRITFLGKEGEKLQGQANIKPKDFIADHAKHWPFPIEIIDDRNQPEALSLMCSRDMIAVMPSLIENSTMAVYEALVHKIPFIATAVGGTPELIEPADHAATLVSPQVHTLADRMGEALEHGHPVARPAFSNDRNLEIWYGFHRYIAENGHKRLSTDKAPDAELHSITYVAAPSNARSFAETIRDRAEIALTTAHHIIVVTFLPTPDVRELMEEAERKGFEVIEAIGASAGEAFNRARDSSTSDILIFDAIGIVDLAGDFFDTVRTALTRRKGDFLTSLFRQRSEDMDGEQLFAPLGADLATQALSGDAYGVECIIGTRAAFDEIGPFETYRVPSGTVHEYIGRAAGQGRELFVIPEPLFAVSEGEFSSGGVNPVCGYLIRKPALENTALATRKLLLIDQDKLGGGKSKQSGGPLVMANAHRGESDIAWLTNVERQGHVNDPVRHNHGIFLGFDRKTGTLHIAIRHTGEFVVKANGDVILHDRNYDTQDELVVSDIELLPFLESQPKTHLRIEMIADGKTRAAGLAVQALEPNVYFLSSHRPIYWGDDFDYMIEKVRKKREEKMRKRRSRQAVDSPIVASSPASVPERAHESTQLAEKSGLFHRLLNKVGF